MQTALVLTVPNFGGIDFAAFPSERLSLTAGSEDKLGFPRWVHISSGAQRAGAVPLPPRPPFPHEQPQQQAQTHLANGFFPVKCSKRVTLYY